MDVQNGSAVPIQDSITETRFNQLEQTLENFQVIYGFCLFYRLK